MAQDTLHNPFTAPEAEDVAERRQGRGERERLRRIARSQRIICWFILAYLGFIGLSLAAPAMDRGGSQALAILTGIYAIGFLILAILALVNAIALFVRLWGVAAGIVCGLLFFVPLVGLLILIAASSRATRLLKDNGYRVGLLGAPMSQFR